MPIPQLMEQISLPVLADIRKGSKRTDTGQMGKDLTYFRFEPLVNFALPGAADQANMLTERWNKAFGEKAEEFTGFFPYPTVDEDLDAWMMYFTAAGLQRKCDGQYVMREMQGASYCNYKYGEMPCKCAAGLIKADKEKCKPSARIYLLIPQLGVAGLVVLHTSSKLDIINLHAQLQAAAALLGGKINEVPFVIKRAPRKISTPRGDGRVQMTKSLLSVHIHPIVTQSRMEQFLLKGTLALEGPTPENRLLVDAQVASEYDGQGAIEVDSRTVAESEMDEEQEEALSDLRNAVLDIASQFWGEKKRDGGLRLWVDRLSGSRTQSLYDLSAEELEKLRNALDKKLQEKGVGAPPSPPVVTAPPAGEDSDEEDGPAETPPADGDDDDEQDATQDGVYSEIEGAAT